MSSQKRFTRALYPHPTKRGVDISTWRGVGLFISPKAFGDASMMIISDIAHAFLFIKLKAIFGVMERHCVQIWHEHLSLFVWVSLPTVEMKQTV